MALKMYILVKASLPSHKAVSIAHAVLIAHRVFSIQVSCAPVYLDWLDNSFRKVVCEVSDADFERFKQYEHHIVSTESAFDGGETCLAFCPREEWPKAFKFLSMSKY
jgi:predicted ArsR family transcriptional regulator